MTAATRLATFETQWEDLFGEFVNDRAYSDGDEELNRRFMAARHAVENLIVGCEIHLEGAEEERPRAPSMAEQHRLVASQLVDLGRSVRA